MNTKILYDKIQYLNHVLNSLENRINALKGYVESSIEKINDFKKNVDFYKLLSKNNCEVLDSSFSYSRFDSFSTHILVKKCTGTKFDSNDTLMYDCLHEKSESDTLIKTLNVNLSHYSIMINPNDEYTGVNINNNIFSDISNEGKILWHDCYVKLERMFQSKFYSKIYGKEGILDNSLNEHMLIGVDNRNRLISWVCSKFNYCWQINSDNEVLGEIVLNVTNPENNYCTHEIVDNEFKLYLNKNDDMVHAYTIKPVLNAESKIVAIVVQSFNDYNPELFKAYNYIPFNKELYTDTNDINLHLSFIGVNDNFDIVYQNSWKGQNLLNYIFKYSSNNVTNITYNDDKPHYCRYITQMQGNWTSLLSFLIPSDTFKDKQIKDFDFYGVQLIYLAIGYDERNNMITAIYSKNKWSFNNSNYGEGISKGTWIASCSSYLNNFNKSIYADVHDKDGKTLKFIDAFLEYPNHNIEYHQINDDYDDAPVEHYFIIDGERKDTTHPYYYINYYEWFDKDYPLNIEIEFKPNENNNTGWYFLGTKNNNVFPNLISIGYNSNGLISALSYDFGKSWVKGNINSAINFGTWCCCDVFDKYILAGGYDEFGYPLLVFYNIDSKTWEFAGKYNTPLNVVLRYDTSGYQTTTFTFMSQDEFYSIAEGIKNVVKINDVNYTFEFGNINYEITIYAGDTIHIADGNTISFRRHGCIGSYKAKCKLISESEADFYYIGENEIVKSFNLKIKDSIPNRRPPYSSKFEITEINEKSVNVAKIIMPNYESYVVYKYKEEGSEEIKSRTINIKYLDNMCIYGTIDREEINPYYQYYAIFGSLKHTQMTRYELHNNFDKYKLISDMYPL